MSPMYKTFKFVRLCVLLYIHGSYQKLRYIFQQVLNVSVCGIRMNLRKIHYQKEKSLINQPECMKNRMYLKYFSDYFCYMFKLLSYVVKGICLF